MENASKALLMAGEVLITIIIISALVLMFNSLTSYQNVKAQNDRDAEVIKFNNRYEAYNRDDIKGNDLFSLINQVVDYNERKSTVGEEGAEFAYQPITINVDLKSIEDRKKFTVDDNPRIFTTDEFTIDSTDKELFSEKLDLETDYSISVITNLAKSTTRIFFDKEEDINDIDLDEAKQRIYNFNTAYGKEEYTITNNETAMKNKCKEINRRYKEAVYTYYEYLQFSRAHFKCTGVEYNQGTGRIEEMNFQFTGKIN